MKRCLVIGSRGSKLALWQANNVQTQLQAITPELTVRIEIIKTTGDVKTDPLTVIGGKGVFTKELEDALLDRRIDIAVHSLKDLPTVLPDNLTIAAICKREDPRDALVLREAKQIKSLHDVTANAVVGTSSQRRLAQLKSARPDLVINDLRGNVDSRIRKLDEGLYDAVILASAGLKRLGLSERISYSITPEEMLPAVGQGAIGIETLRDDEFTVQTVKKLEHEPTRIACLAERALLRSLGGGCQFPIAAHAIIVGENLRLDGLVATPDGSTILKASLSGSAIDPERLGISVANKLKEQGAESLLSQR